MAKEDNNNNKKNKKEEKKDEDLVSTPSISNSNLNSN